MICSRYNTLSLLDSIRWVVHEYTCDHLIINLHADWHGIRHVRKQSCMWARRQVYCITTGNVNSNFRVVYLEFVPTNISLYIFVCVIWLQRQLLKMCCCWFCVITQLWDAPVFSLLFFWTQSIYLCHSDTHVNMSFLIW